MGFERPFEEKQEHFPNPEGFIDITDKDKSDIRRYERQLKEQKPHPLVEAEARRNALKAAKEKAEKERARRIASADPSFGKPENGFEGERGNEGGDSLIE